MPYPAASQSTGWPGIINGYFFFMEIRSFITGLMTLNGFIDARFCLPGENREA
jgi:hypothetical protein